MSYLVIYNADAWMPAANGAPEWRQVVSSDLGNGTSLVVVIVRSASGSPPRVAEARIEQAYVTRASGWKRRTLRRVHPREIQLSEPDAPPSP